MDLIGREAKMLRGYRRREAAWETAKYPPVDAHFHISWDSMRAFTEWRRRP